MAKSSRGVNEGIVNSGNFTAGAVTVGRNAQLKVGRQITKKTRGEGQRSDQELIEKLMNAVAKAAPPESAELVDIRAKISELKQQLEAPKRDRSAWSLSAKGLMDALKSVGMVIPGALQIARELAGR